ncbi:helix-hairpin-helix domain-containing protein [Persephonella sp.]
MTVEPKLLEVQRVSIILIIFTVVSLKILDLNLTPPKVTKKDLQIDINTASKKQLTKVPYIGNKTADKIIGIRNSSGKIDNIYKLKEIRNFNKFKYYIKVE